MAPRFITVAEVRTIVGIIDSQISDGDVEDIIEDVEYQIERYYNTVFKPKEEIEVLDGNGKHVIFVNNAPLLAVREIKDDGVNIDVKTINFSNSGRIRLTNFSTVANFRDKENGLIVGYVYGRVIFPEGGPETKLTADATSGSNVVLNVGAITDFAQNDWIEIYGFDGKKEVAKINTAPAGSTIQVDKLVFDHVSTSFIRKLDIPVIIKRLMKISSALAMVARIVGQSFDDIVGYTMGEFQVQKGEPYTQWRETALELIKERDEILQRVHPTATILM